MKVTVVIAVIFVVGIMVFGAFQAFDSTKGTLAGAAALDTPKEAAVQSPPPGSPSGTIHKPRTQDEIGACVKDCMWGCVTVEGTERPCLDKCNEKCGGP
jgi:hypothetical protein